MTIVPKWLHLLLSSSTNKIPRVADTQPHPPQLWVLCGAGAFLTSKPRRKGMIKQNEGPSCRLEWIFNLLQPVGWQPLVLYCAQRRGLGDLLGARAGLELPPTSFAHQCNPSCSSPSCPNELLRNSSLFIKIKPRSCPSRGHPSELPALEQIPPTHPAPLTASASHHGTHSSLSSWN